MIIGPSKYSKDISLKPDSIVLTLPKQFFDDRGWSIEKFNKYFERVMRKEDWLWNFRLTNLPSTNDIAWVYLVYGGFFQWKMNFVQYERNVSKSFSDGPKKAAREFPNANWVILAGPPVKAPEGWPQKGFQGFRYACNLF
jgi:hypothetical protein